MNERALSLGSALMRVRPAPLAALFKTMLRVHRVEHSTAEGVFWIDPASYQGQALGKTGFYEPTLTGTIKSLLSLGDTFIDLGANEGYFSVIASKSVGASGTVLAIEPQQRLQRVLQRNFELNLCSNTQIAQVAVSDTAGNATMHLTPGMNNSASSLIQPTRYPLFRENVPTLTLEQVLDQAKLANCKMLKIDIEGWEYEAVLGSKSFFESGRAEYVALELHPHLLAKRDLDGAKITEFLSACGYREQPGFDHLLLKYQPV